MSVSVSGTTVTFPDSSTITSGWTGFKNRIINGAMVIDQRNAGASVTVPANTQTFSVDRFPVYGSQASKISIQQNAGSVTPPVGFTNYLGITSLSSYSVVSSDIFNIYPRIEGNNIADFGWGTANASTITLSFWVRSSLTGSFSICLQNSAQNRAYATLYTISSANTWEYKTITIAGDTSGTWLTNNNTGISLNFGLGNGSTYTTSTTNSWVSGTYFGASGATSVVGTNGATFYITGVQLEKGSTASSFEYRAYGQELLLCQRYFQIIADGADNSNEPVAVGMCLNSTDYYYTYRFLVQMRSAPTSTLSGSIRYYKVNGVSSVTSSGLATGTASPRAIRYDFTGTGGTAGDASWFQLGGNSTDKLVLSAEL